MAFPAVAVTALGVLGAESAVAASGLAPGIGGSVGATDESQWQDDARGEVVRYVAAVGYRANLRSTPTLRTPGTVAAKLPGGTVLKGRYNETGLWFHVSQGPWRGRWIASSLVQERPEAKSSNGVMPAERLAPIPSGSARQAGAQQMRLARMTAHAFTNMNTAFRAKFGHDLGVLEGYRPLATQKRYANKFGFPRAAIPGTSNHGFGNAIDVGQLGRPGVSSPFYFGHVYDKWLTANAWKWGFDRPDDLDAGGSNPEFWHYNFVG